MLLWEPSLQTLLPWTDGVVGHDEVPRQEPSYHSVSCALCALSSGTVAVLGVQLELVTGSIALSRSGALENIHRQKGATATLTCAVKLRLGGP